MPPPQQQIANVAPTLPSTAANGLPNGYAYQQQANGNTRIKAEPGTEQYNVQHGYQERGGIHRAQQLAQQYQQANGVSVPRGPLALPGQQARPQGLQMPNQQTGSQMQQQQQYSAQYQHNMRQQQQLQQQQAQPRIKVENDSPLVDQNGFQQPARQPNPAYVQTDGADDGLEEWQAMLAERRAMHAAHGQRADRMMRNQVLQMSSTLQSGLMVPLDQQPKRGTQKSRTSTRSIAPAGPSIPQLDGDADDDDEKPEIKDEDDENAINSDLDDSDEEGQGQIGDDDDDGGDTILCTYDKVQRVKNKWKCVLKDGVLSTGGKEYVFHKGSGEFEW